MEQLGLPQGDSDGQKEVADGLLLLNKMSSKSQTSRQGTGPQACLHQVWATRLGLLLPSQATFGKQCEQLQLETTLLWSMMLSGSNTE